MARYLKPIIVSALLVPWSWLAYRVYLETLLVGSGRGADPVEGLIHYLGEWSLIVLLSPFSVTPLSRQFKWPMLMAERPDNHFHVETLVNNTLNIVANHKIPPRSLNFSLSAAIYLF